MRKFSYVSIVIAVLMNGFSCSDDFLNEEAPALYTYGEPLIISTQSSETAINMNIPQAGNEKFHIRTYPKWIEFKTLHGVFKDGKATLNFTFTDPDYETASGCYTADLVIAVENTGYFKIEIVCCDPASANN